MKMRELEEHPKYSNRKDVPLYDLCNSSQFTLPETLLEREIRLSFVSFTSIDVRWLVSFHKLKLDPGAHASCTCSLYGFGVSVTPPPEDAKAVQLGADQQLYSGRVFQLTYISLSLSLLGRFELLAA
jgi:hypothetical protein